MVLELDKQNILTVGSTGVPVVLTYIHFPRRLIYFRFVLFQDLDLFKKCGIIAVVFGVFTQQDSLPFLILAFLGQGFKDNI